MAFLVLLMSGLPQLSLFLLGWHFDDSGLVDDPRRSLTLLDNTNDPSLVALLLLNVLQANDNFQTLCALKGMLLRNFHSMTNNLEERL